MTNEELDEARAEEAIRLQIAMIDGNLSNRNLAVITARLAREGWTPPEPVDQDLLAWREWVRQTYPNCADIFNNWELDGLAENFIAGARMAREQERERAKVLVEFVEMIIDGRKVWGLIDLCDALAKYRGEA